MSRGEGGEQDIFSARFFHA